MEGFNLLPEQYQKRRGARFVPVSIVVTLALAVLCLVLMEQGVVARATRGAGSSLAKTLSAREAELAERRRERQTIEAEVKPLVAVLSRTPIWSNVFIDVAGVVGPDVQITRWSADTDRGLCSIQGRAETNTAVFQLVVALEALPYFETVTLAAVSKEQDAKGYGVRFEIITSIRQALQ
jgi:Tfp pilus assembly protein PilN